MNMGVSHQEKIQISDEVLSAICQFVQNIFKKSEEKDVFPINYDVEDGSWATFQLE